MVAGQPVERGQEREAEEEEGGRQGEAGDEETVGTGRDHQTWGQSGGLQWSHNIRGGQTQIQSVISVMPQRTSDISSCVFIA